MSILLTLAAAMWVAPMSTRGDVFELVNGGRIEGTQVEAQASKESYVIDTPGGRLTIARSQVEKVETPSDDEKEYLELARRVPDTVDDHWKLAEWCRQRKLRRESQKHLARILELDPHHADARTLLGFRKKDGEWMTRDEVMNSRGLVLYEGRYVTPQHIELMERTKETKLSQADWSDKFERWRRALVGRREDRAAQALAEIHAVRDPMAGAAVTRLLEREENLELKRLWIDCAARIGDPDSTRVLVDLSLYDPDEEIRFLCVDKLADFSQQGLLRPYIRALGDKDNEIVNRAALAIAQLGDRDAIAPLINALVTKHRFQISGGNPGQIGASFSPNGGGGGMSFGGGGPKFETRTLRNPAVLNALVQLAGTSFDYDQDAWHAWHTAQARMRPINIRRDQ